MLHEFFTYGIKSSGDVSELRFSFEFWESSSENTQYFANIWKSALSPFPPLLTTPLVRFMIVIFRHVVFAFASNTVQAFPRGWKTHV